MYTTGTNNTGHCLLKLFSNILIPVGLDLNNPLTIENAIQIANEYQCDVHLLYILPQHQYHIFGTVATPDILQDATLKMNALSTSYTACLNRELSLHTSIQSGDRFTIVKDYVISHYIDLVLLTGNSSLFSGEQWYINRLIKQTGCAVLTANGHFLIDNIRNIILPVDNYIPAKKITVAASLARKYNAIIHLVQNKKKWLASGNTQDYAKKAYRLLRNSSLDHIHYVETTDNDNTQDVLTYARHVQADIIITNPDAPGSRWRSLLCNLFKKETSISTLTLAPYQ